MVNFGRRVEPPDYSSSTVKAQTSRGIRRLRDSLTEKEPEQAEVRR